MRKILILLTLTSIIGGSIIGCGTNEKEASKNVENNVEVEEVVEYGGTDIEEADKFISNDNEVEIKDDKIDGTSEDKMEEEIKVDVTEIVVDNIKDEIVNEKTSEDGVKDKAEDNEEKAEKENSQKKSSNNTEKKKDSSTDLTFQEINGNQFYNDNPDLLLNSVSIDPYLIKFDNNNLVVEAFVINGFEHNVYDIDVKELTIYNEDDEVIASASDFGILQDVTIAPLSYIRWTFVFAHNTIYKVDDDFNSIRYYCNVDNKY